MADRESCAWCGAALPSPAAVGRPREYCSRSCRQRAYEHRHVRTVDDTAEQVIVVRREQLDDLRDRLFALRRAVEDVGTALAEHASPAELERVCRELVHSAGDLDRLWVGPSGARAS